MDRAQQNPLLSVLKLAGFVFFVLLLTFVGLTIWTSVDTNPEHRALSAALMGSISSVGQTAWTFVRPLLQLIIVLVILDWVLRRTGIQLGAGVRRFDWNVQAIIAIIVVAAYAVAELGGIGDSGLKDITLVVVGFYFGTQRHSFEVDPKTGKLRVLDEHLNPLGGATGKGEGGNPPSEVLPENAAEKAGQ